MCLSMRLLKVREIAEGKHDDVPEQAFYMVGNIDEAISKAGQIK